MPKDKVFFIGWKYTPRKICEKGLKIIFIFDIEVVLEDNSIAFSKVNYSDFFINYTKRVKYHNL